jgi:hypothetical protein
VHFCVFWGFFVFWSDFEGFDLGGGLLVFLEISYEDLI